MNIQPYDHADFVQNPEKYRQFKTAVIAEKIESSPHFKVGDYVSIKYEFTAPNPPRRVNEMPVYLVSKAGEPVSDLDRSYLYACALGNFAL